MTGIAHNDTNMNIRHQHTTKCVHCYIFMNNTSELRMSWILGNITQLCIHVSVYAYCDFLSYLHTVHESRCIYTYCDFLSYLHTVHQSRYIYIYCDFLSCDFLSVYPKNVYLYFAVGLFLNKKTHIIDVLGVIFFLNKAIKLY